jgi:hypothetical protein
LTTYAPRVRLSAIFYWLTALPSVGSTSPSMAIMFGLQNRSNRAFGHFEIRDQLSSKPLSVRFGEDSAMTPSWDWPEQ